MNITGTFSGVGETGTVFKPVLSGAFYTAIKQGATKVRNTDANPDDLFGFDASRSWTGETSWCDDHTHTISIGNNGSGQAYDSRPQYISVYMWIRTA